MRRVPYIKIKDRCVYYICPWCNKVIPRDFYKSQDWCPTCEKPINREARMIMSQYKQYDIELYYKFHK